MNIYAFNNNSKTLSDDLLTYSIEITNSILRIEGGLEANSSIKKIIEIDIKKLHKNIRYEVLIPDTNFVDKNIIVNYDENYNINNNSVFFEIFYLNRLMFGQCAIRLYKINETNLFINSDIQLKSNTISFSEYQNTIDMKKEIEEKTGDIEAAEQYNKYWQALEYKLDLINNLPARASISYLDIQSDIYSKIINSILNALSEEQKNKILAEVNDEINMLQAFNEYNISNLKTKEEMLETINTRKKDVRTKQKEYYEAIRSL